MSNKTGGPAFPYSGVHKGENENFIIDTHGMTLRDYFAAKAMAGEMSSTEPLSVPENIASRAYAIADAMLKEREAKS